MAKIRAFFTNWWTVSVLTAILLALILAIGLPPFVGFLRPWWVRLLIVLTIALAWNALAYLRIRRARRASDAIATGLAAPLDAESEVNIQSRRMTEALAALRASSGGRRDYLYSRPWYVIIGPPGAGKTTALVNSGLRFPFSDQALQGQGGTRNLDFWFADEAALIDTAGRYTSQDSDAPADARAWNNFLALLKKNRPLQPINGIIVAIGCDELIRADRAAIDAHSGAVRRRLSELRRALEVNAPAYVLFTKADLIAGFVEYFDDLDVEGRRAVLGHTLPLSGGSPGSGALVTAFDDMTRSVADRQAKRLAEEPDPQRRSLILGFPNQLLALRSRLSRYLEGAFPHGDANGAMLRGFYVTSGVQHGAPLDRLLAGISEVFDQPAEAGRPGGGRAYFLNRLLGEVMFSEAGLVQTDRAARVRQRTRLVAAVGAIAAASLLIVGLWALSFTRNRAFQTALHNKAEEARQLERDRGIDLVQYSASDADLEQAVAVLDALRDLPRGYAERAAGSPPLAMRFGLFQGGLSFGAEGSYRDGLRRILLPRLLARLETVIGEDLSNPLAVYEPLKVYLLLGGQKPGALDKSAVRNWVVGDWASGVYAGAGRSDLRRRLALHLDALIDDPHIAGAWAPAPAPLDWTLVGQARVAVQRMTPADRAYAIMKAKAMAASGAPWTAAGKLGSGDAQAFANGAEVLALQVPRFFTVEGFQDTYQPRLLTVQRDIEDDMWVMGDDANADIVRQSIAGVRPGVAALYAKDYEAAWDAVVAAMKPADYFRDPAALATFTKTPSPFAQLLREVRRNTLLGGGPADAARKMAMSRVAARLGQAAAVLPANDVGGGSGDAGADITLHFKSLHDFAGSGPGAPVDVFVDAVKQAGQAVDAARQAGGGVAGAPLQAEMLRAQAAVRSAAAGAPQMLQGFIAQAAQGGATAQTSTLQGAISETYAQVVLPACKAVVQERYPFFASGQADADMLATLQLFAVGATIDSFVRDRLQPLLVTGPVWRWTSDNPIAAAFNPESADQFSKAARIRDLLATPLNFRVSLESLGPGVDAVEFATGGISARFDMKSAAPRPFIWSAQTLPEAHVTLVRGGQPLDPIAGQGPWAVFHLMDKARERRNAGAGSFLVRFAQGDSTATLRVSLATEQNPFSRGDVWTFRCPVTL